MRTSVIKWALVALLSATAAGLQPGRAQAQFANPRNPAFGAFQPAVNSNSFVNPNFRINPNLGLQQAAFNTAVLGQAISQVPAYALGFNPYVSPVSINQGGLGTGSLVNNPYYGGGYGNSLTSNGYGGGYNPYMPYYDPYASALMGAADIINSQGKFLISNEQSWLMHEQQKQARIETRRKLFDEYKYERENTPSSQDLRERDQKTLYRRSITNPPTNEILSGDSLNTLLDHLTKIQASGGRGPSVPLEESTLSQVNVRPDGRSGNIGLLKNLGNVKWPLPLQAAEYDKERKRLDEYLPMIVKQAKELGVDPGTLNAIREDVEKLQERFSGNVNDLGTGRYIEGKRFLNALDDAVQALGQQDATNYFNHKYEAKGKTVAELVNYMKEKGLRFAPSVAGEESAYRALHQAMVAYDANLTQVATKDSGDSGKSKD
jgi:hypothetical protein